MLSVDCPACREHVEVVFVGYDVRPDDRQLEYVYRCRRRGHLLVGTEENAVEVVPRRRMRLTVPH